MDLFHQEVTENLLPFDGDVIYKGFAIDTEECKYYFHKLFHTIPWKNDEAIIFGKHYKTSRKVAWFGDKEFEYTYSNITKRAHIWSEELLTLKSKVERLSETTFNSCLLNLYHNGSEGMSWHSDGEKTLKENGTIASLTLGAERKFSFKHKETKRTVDILLQNGSLLLMKGTTQKYWLHRLPPTKKVNSPRINLTFRTIIL